jgi:hypothetical protein
MSTITLNITISKQRVMDEVLKTTEYIGSKAVSEQEYPAICKVTKTWPLYRRALRTSASELSPRNRLEAQILEKGYFRAIARIYKLCAMVGHAG